MLMELIKKTDEQSDKVLSRILETSDSCKTALKTVEIQMKRTSDQYQLEVLAVVKQKLLTEIINEYKLHMGHDVDIMDDDIDGIINEYLFEFENYKKGATSAC